MHYYIFIFNINIEIGTNTEINIWIVQLISEYFSLFYNVSLVFSTA